MTNLFHAYVIGGARANARAHIEELLAPYEILRLGNPDFFVTEHTAFTIDDARDLRTWQTLVPAAGARKIRIVYTDFINSEAQNTLLKTLEEPVEGTHIIFAVPKPETLLPTVLSRVRLVMPSVPQSWSDNEIKKFLSMTMAERMVYVAKIAEKGEDDDAAAQVREKAVAFIDNLEKNFSEKLLENPTKEWQSKIELILKLKKYLFISGASVRIILETLALTI